VYHRIQIIGKIGQGPSLVTVRDVRDFGQSLSYSVDVRLWYLPGYEYIASNTGAYVAEACPQAADDALFAKRAHAPQNLVFLQCASARDFAIGPWA